MSRQKFPQIELNIARCRMILSVMALIAVYADPTDAILRTGIAKGWFAIDLLTVLVMLTHLAYSIAVFYVVRRAALTLETFTRITTWGDVLIGTAIAFVTEGVSSPFYAFFVFAVVQVGIRGGFRRTIAVTSVSVVLYLSLIAVSAPGWLNFYIMRPVYLAIIGYLVAYLGQQRLNLEAEIHDLAVADQRNRIARDLHDGWAQAFAAISLRIESCSELLCRGRGRDAAVQLGELQESVRREYDDLRSYMRALAGLEPSLASAEPNWATRVTIRAEWSGTGPFVEHVLQILREGVGNVVRHAGARSAHLEVKSADGTVTIAIDDDGIGFRDERQRPWSIVSRVRELEGELRVIRDAGPGAHLSITVPQA